MGVSGRVFLPVAAYPGNPGPTVVKRLCCVCMCVVLFTHSVQYTTCISGYTAQLDTQNQVLVLSI